LNLFIFLILIPFTALAALYKDDRITAGDTPHLIFEGTKTTFSFVGIDELEISHVKNQFREPFSQVAKHYVMENYLNLEFVPSLLDGC